MRGTSLSLDRFAAEVADGLAGDEVGEAEVSVGFLTQQGARHAGRGRSYRNHVLSLRVEDAVGSCAVEPGLLTDELVVDCVGSPVRALLRHPEPAVRIAALDAYLMWRHPHHEHGEEVRLRRGSSLNKSVQRAQQVVDLLPTHVGRVLVIGVVNSLLERLRHRGVNYVACDLKGGTTEWGEPIARDAMSEVDGCDAVLASGMVAGNGTFDPLLGRARDTGIPLVLFAQTASGILPWFLGSGVTAISAEPYPFFWLDGGPSSIYRYPQKPGKDLR
ncbi:Rossmann-like domain-containing protein [Saccharopolyspora sp. MS10]|uniref:Rossmann-like domain-containing protein n=1 Tax=Saccharopolyspora sp. MS10 TaxID=3385973 RepID=UPI0039A38C3B